MKFRFIDVAISDNVQNAVNETLVNHADGSFPICPKQIARSMGIKVIPSDALLELDLIDIYNAVKRTTAITMFYAGKTAIIYNGDCDPRIQRWSIAHELGHIVLKHDYKDDDPFFSFLPIDPETEEIKKFAADRHTQELDADFFANYLLSPPILQWAFDTNSTYDIMRTFGLTAHAAYHAAYQLQLKRNARHDFLRDSMNRAIYTKHLPAIRQHNRKEATPHHEQRNRTGKTRCYIHPRIYTRTNRRLLHRQSKRKTYCVL